MKSFIDWHTEILSKWNMCLPTGEIKEIHPSYVFQLLSNQLQNSEKKSEQLSCITIAEILNVIILV